MLHPHHEVGQLIPKYGVRRKFDSVRGFLAQGASLVCSAVAIEIGGHRPRERPNEPHVANPVGQLHTGPASCKRPLVIVVGKEMAEVVGCPQLGEWQVVFLRVSGRPVQKRDRFVKSPEIPERSSSSNQTIENCRYRPKPLSRSHNPIAEFRGLLVAQRHEVGTS